MKKKHPAQPLRAIATLREMLDSNPLACSGTLSKRMRPCGKPNCRCATDPNALHGPYYEWSRRQSGRTVCTRVSAVQARRLQQAIATFRDAQALMRQWDRQSREHVLAGPQA